MNRRGLKRSQLVATGVAALISVIFIVTLVAPGPTTVNEVVTPVAPDTNSSRNFEPSDAALNIENPEPYVHPSGIFQSYRPALAQWQLLTNSSTPIEGERGQVVDARFRGNQSCAVIHLLAEVNGDYESVDELNNVMSRGYFEEAWGQYGSWEQANRELLEDRIVAEFTLRQPTDFSAQCPDTYRARTISWVANGTAQHVRLVVRNNDQDSLDRMEALVVPSFILFPHNTAALGSNSNWRVQSNTAQAHFFLVPSTGFTLDNTVSTEERPLYRGTVGTNNATVAVETITDLDFEDVDAAQEWLAAFIPSNAEITNSATVQQPYASGYLFSYNFTDAEGLTTSGGASLLSDGQGTLHFLELQVSGIETDILVEEPEDFVTDQAGDIARSFTIMIPAY